MKKILFLLAAVITTVTLNAKIIDFSKMALSIDDWKVSEATLNDSYSDVSSGKYAYNTAGGIVSSVSLYNDSNVVFQYKNSSDKSRAYTIYTGARFEFSGKNGVLILKNTSINDTITLVVASKGSTAAGFQCTNATAISPSLNLPAKSSDFVWQTLEFVSLGGDVEIKEINGGYTISAIYIGERSEAITIQVEVPASITNPYIYAWDANYNNFAGEWPGSPMQALGNRVYSYTFNPGVLAVNVIFNDYYNTNYQTDDITNITSSTCFKLSNNFTCTQVDCSEIGQPIAMDSVVIRFNPYSVEWDNAYLYVWSDYYNYSSSNSTKWVQAQKMQMAEDGWWTSSFAVERGTQFYVGFNYQSNSNPYYYNSNITYSASTCFEYENGLNTVAYRKLTPDESNSFTIHVATAGTFGQVMVQMMGEFAWSDVLALTVTGSLNETDITYFSRMTNLQQLDLSGTNLVSIGECRDLCKLTNIVLPETCLAINENAFYGCKRLKTINLEHVQTIGNYAFYQCSLINANMTNVESIGNNAFYENTQLTSLSMPLASSIGKYAFYNCYALEQVDMPNVTSLGTYTFGMNNSSYSLLSQVTFSNELTEIPNNCFSGCSVLTSLILPDALTTIGNNALPYVSNVLLPANVISVGSGNFTNATSINIPANVTTWKSYSSSWADVYCSVVVPPVFSVFDVSSVASATLHVNGISLAAYKLHDIWYKFGRIISMDGDMENIAITGDFMLLTTDGIAENANLSIDDGGALTMSAADTLKLGNYVQQIASLPQKSVYEGFSYDDNGSYMEIYSYYLQYTGILAANSPISADSVLIQLVPKANQWNFFSLPFDVNMSDITIGTEGTGTIGTSQWVIREYSGANRASGNGATWNNVPANGVLQAHKGYILYWVVDGSSTYKNNSTSSSATLLYYFNMPAVDNANKHDIFAIGDVNVPLKEYIAEFPQNGSWNLVGNPYPCAFDIQQMDFEAPITVWNGSGYTAYSLEDDHYTLRPAEAFFVQAPEGTDHITFHKEGRLASIMTVQGMPQYHAPKRLRTINSARKVFNFTLSDDNYSDRARLVLNEEASADYELTRDAAKMLSTDKSVPQLYISDNGVRYAINERSATNGVYYMSAFFGKNGQYSIKVQSDEVQSTSIILTDTQNGVATDLTENDYTFTTDAGTYENRFEIYFAPKMPTGVDNVQGGNAPCTKVLRDNQLIIIKNGNKYNVQGQIIK